MNLLCHKYYYDSNHYNNLKQKRGSLCSLFGIAKICDGDIEGVSHVDPFVFVNIIQIGEGYDSETKYSNE